MFKHIINDSLLLYIDLSFFLTFVIFKDNIDETIKIFIKKSKELYLYL
jgi:hypothetical protein